VALVRKAAGEKRIVISFQSFEVKIKHELAVTSNKLTNNFMGQIARGVGPDVAAGR
jgi:hypothetical protein